MISKQAKVKGEASHTTNARGRGTCNSVFAYILPWMHISEGTNRAVWPASKSIYIEVVNHGATLYISHKMAHAWLYDLDLVLQDPIVKRSRKHLSLQRWIKAGNWDFQPCCGSDVCSLQQELSMTKKSSRHINCQLQFSANINCTVQYANLDMPLKQTRVPIESILQWPLPLSGGIRTLIHLFIYHTRVTT